MSSQIKLRLFLLVSAVIALISSCGDRLSSTYPRMKAFVSNAGFMQYQNPSPTNLGPTAPWYGIAKQLDSEYIVVIYPVTQKLFTVPLGVNGRLTRSQMVQVLIHKKYQQVNKRLWLRGQTDRDEHNVALFWVYNDGNGFPSQYFDLQGKQMNMQALPEMAMKATRTGVVFSFG